MKPVTGSPYLPKDLLAAQEERKKKLFSRDTQQYCRNGHSINWWVHDHPSENKAFCPECGASTLHACENCGKEIAGGLRLDHNDAWARQFSSAPPQRPAFCENCGTAFAWAPASPAPPVPAIEPSPLPKLLQRFPLVVHQLQQRYDGRPPFVVNDEYDAQDLLHALLRVFYDDVRREEWTPSYAGKAARIDFLLKDERAVVELKRARAGHGAKEIGDELIIDIARYRNHPDCDALYCLVYDPDRLIANPRGLEADLARDGQGIRVHVFVVS